MKMAFLYKWINGDTKEFYIGVHEGATDDGYVASGATFLAKYNEDKTKWEREILSRHDTMALALKKEAKVVTQDMVNDPLCLNQMIGGEPTFTAVELKHATLSALYHRFNLGNKDCKEAFKNLWGHYPNKHWYPQPWTEPTLYALASSLARVVVE